MEYKPNKLLENYFKNVYIENNIKFKPFCYNNESILSSFDNNFLLNQVPKNYSICLFQKTIDLINNKNKSKVMQNTNQKKKLIYNSDIDDNKFTNLQKHDINKSSVYNLINYKNTQVSIPYCISNLVDLVDVVNNKTDIKTLYSRDIYKLKEKYRKISKTNENCEKNVASIISDKSYSNNLFNINKEKRLCENVDNYQLNIVQFIIDNKLLKHLNINNNINNSKITNKQLIENYLSKNKKNSDNKQNNIINIKNNIEVLNNKLINLNFEINSNYYLKINLNKFCSSFFLEENTYSLNNATILFKMLNFDIYSMYVSSKIFKLNITNYLIKKSKLIKDKFQNKYINILDVKQSLVKIKLDKKLNNVKYNNQYKDLSIIDKLKFYDFLAIDMDITFKNIIDVNLLDNINLFKFSYAYKVLNNNKNINTFMFKHLNNNKSINAWLCKEYLNNNNNMSYTQPLFPTRSFNFINININLNTFYGYIDVIDFTQLEIIFKKNIKLYNTLLNINELLNTQIINFINIDQVLNKIVNNKKINYLLSSIYNYDIYLNKKTNILKTININAIIKYVDSCIDSKASNYDKIIIETTKFKLFIKSLNNKIYNYSKNIDSTSCTSSIKLINSWTNNLLSIIENLVQQLSNCEPKSFNQPYPEIEYVKNSWRIVDISTIYNKKSMLKEFIEDFFFKCNNINSNNSDTLNNTNIKSVNFDNNFSTFNKRNIKLNYNKKTVNLLYNILKKINEDNNNFLDLNNVYCDYIGSLFMKIKFKAVNNGKVYLSMLNINIFVNDLDHIEYNRINSNKFCINIKKLGVIQSLYNICLIKNDYLTLYIWYDKLAENSFLI